MQSVSGGSTPLAGASTTLPRTSPNQANPTASQQYATLPLQASIPKTQALQSHVTEKVENAPSATCQPSVSAYASALDGAATHLVQSSASPAKYASLPTQTTFINQGSYSAAVPATVHYAVQVPNYGIPPLPQMAPPPPPHVCPPFPDVLYTEHASPSIPVPNSTFPTQTDAANKDNPLNNLQIGYSAGSSVPVPSPSAAFNLSTEETVKPSSQTQYRQYSTHPNPSASSSVEGVVPPQSQTLYSQYSPLPPFTTSSSVEEAVPPQSHTLYSQYSTLPPSANSSSTAGAAPSQSHSLYSQYSALPPSATSLSTAGAGPAQSQSLYSQYSALSPSNIVAFTERAILPPSDTLYSQYSTLPPSTATCDEADIYSSTDDLLDPIARSRKPNARLSGKKINPMEVGL